MTRQLTRARLDALQQADAFLASTSPDVARMELIDALEIARCRFALSDAELLYLRLAIRNVPQSHWGQGREPIFAWARIDVARVLGKCERTVHRIEAALVRKGLVVHRDGPRLQRWRRPDGTAGAGVSLAPCAARANEILCARDEVIAEQRSWREARRTLYALKRELAGLLDLASAPADIGDVVREFIEAIPRRVAADAALADLRDLISRAREISRQLLAAIGMTERSYPGNTPVPPSNRPDSMDPDLPQLPLQSRPRLSSARYARADAEAVVAMGQEVGIEPEMVIAAVRAAGIDACKSALTAMVARATGTRQREPLRSPAAYLRTLTGIKSQDRKKWNARLSCVKMAEMQ